MNIVDMYDTIHSTVQHLPASITSKIAGYTTGSSGIKWTQADWDRFPHAAHVRIDQAPGSANPFGADVKDVEDRAATIADFVAWAQQRWNGKKWITCGYISKSQAGALVAACVKAGLPSQAVTLWIADWDLNRAQAASMVGTHVGPYRIVAVQWAAPESNPNTVLPGTGLTLKQANVDLSVADESWFAAPKPAPAPAPAGMNATLNLAVGGTHVQIPIKSSDGGKNWAG